MAATAPRKRTKPVTRRDWSRVPAGDEVNAAVAQETLGRRHWLKRRWYPADRQDFSRNDEDALRLLTRLAREQDWTMILEYRRADSGGRLWERAEEWRCTLSPEPESGERWETEGLADTLALAICRALLVFETTEREEV
jgi:hypothetical protein